MQVREKNVMRKGSIVCSCDLKEIASVMLMQQTEY